MDNSSWRWNVMVLGIFGIIALMVALLRNSDVSPYEYLERGLKAYSEKKYEKAAKYFGKADEAGCAEATFVLGNMYINGFGVPLNVPTAITYYRRAAEAQYTPALYTLALLYMDGSLVARDVPLAHVYISKAAENGDIEAMTTLATWYERGYLGAGKINLALKWYRLAARNGDTNAQTALSLFYSRGMYGLPKDYKEAARWTAALEKKQAYADRFSGKPIQSEKDMTFTIEQMPKIKNMMPFYGK